jgi:hypothetical protein
MKEQLQLKEIVGYLPYGLKCISQVENLGVETIKGFEIYSSGIELITNIDNLHILESKPILFPIFLFKDINSNEMNELNVDLFNQMELCDLANKKIHFQNCNHSTILICLENKIDFQNLIEKGLAIAVTEDFNPYK